MLQSTLQAYYDWLAEEPIEQYKQLHLEEFEDKKYVCCGTGEAYEVEKRVVL